MRNAIPFDEWLERIKVLAEQEYGFAEFDISDREAWRDYWNEGYCPEDALVEDLSHA